jgi:hypothetical protein
MIQVPNSSIELRYKGLTFWWKKNSIFPLISMPASSGHPDSAAGQTPVFDLLARHLMAVVLAFALCRFTSTPAIAATPLMRGLHVTAVHNITALTPV